MKKKTKVENTLPIQESTPQIPSGNFWTMRIEPGKPSVLGKDLWPATMVLKNYGPAKIAIDTGYGFGENQLELLPGSVRVFATHNKVEVATIDANSALLEFEYMPKIRLK